MPSQLSPRNDTIAAALQQLYDFMSAPRRGHFYMVLALMILGSFAELAMIGAVVPFLALLAGHAEAPSIPGLGSVERLGTATAMFMAAVIVAGAIRLLLAWSSQRFVLGLGHDLAVEIQRRTLLQPYSYHVRRNSSEMLAALQKVQDFVSGVLLQLMQATTATFVSLFIVVALILVDPFTAIVAAVALAALYGLVSLFTRKRLAHNSRQLGTAYGERVQIIQESLGGIRDVIVDHSQSTYVEEFRKVDRRFATARANTAFIAAAPRFVIEAVGMVLIAAFALLLADREGGLAAAIPIIGALALGAQRLLPLMQQLYQGWTNLAGNRSIILQVVEALHLPIEKNAEAPASPPLQFRTEINFDRVSFAYPDRAHPAVVDISFSIPCGSRLALVGKTGSGKSTLADLLMGLLQPDEGGIAVDGVALTRDTRRAWQQNIAHVPQAIFLADSSISRNIALGAASGGVDPKRVAEAAKVAQLDIFINSLPEGYETRVGERGVRLSGGQRQRLGIARAIYKNARVLLLDEATSALDQETEAAVMAALDQLGEQGRTIIIIAHRRSTIATCDLVARLDGGRLVEIGSYEQLFGSDSRATVEI